MKYFYILLIAFIFVGCEPIETEAEKAERLAQEAILKAKTDKHIIYGGDGSFSSPYVAGNGSYGSMVTQPYYSIDVNVTNSDLLLYEDSCIYTYNLNVSNSNGAGVGYSSQSTTGYSSFKSFSDLSVDTYKISAYFNEVSPLTEFRLGIYSPTLGSPYNYELPTILNNTSTNFTTCNKLYKYTTSSDINLRITNNKNLDDVVIFNSELSPVATLGVASFVDYNLVTGTYYFYFQSNDRDTIVTLSPL